MRTALTIAAFAAGALAVPYAKRDVITNYDVVYVTDVVTVTAGQLPSEAPKAKPYHYPHGHGQQSISTTVIEQVSTQAPSTYVAPPPSSTPEPEPTTQPTSTYVAPKSSAPASSPAAAAPSSNDYSDICVYHHNLHRANHSAPAVTWSQDLADTALEIAKSCIYAHDTSKGSADYGQNIAAGVEAGNISAIITDLFYNGEVGYFANEYGKPDPDMTYFEKWGHFSQIVWKGTNEVGCATQYCPNGLANVGTGVSPYFTVCNYRGPGNYAGEYADNVLSPKGESTVNWNAGLNGGAASY